MPDTLVVTREQLLRSHDYAQPQIEAGYRLHGGFLGDGRYASPRTLVRTPAVERWATALQAKGGTLIDVSRGILPTETWPSYAQSKLLLKSGLGRTFWTSLTTTGIIEARGGALCQVTPPDFQPLVAEDLAETATGHLDKGLLWAHGADEAGDPVDRAIGAHDVMWFAARDMVFDKDAYAMPDVPRATRTELTGSTITISSLGALGGIVSTPVINHPEVAIIGINRIALRPVIRDGVVVARQMMNLSCSFDHRVVDGLHAAEFVQAIRGLLEAPALLFVEP